MRVNDVTSSNVMEMKIDITLGRDGPFIIRWGIHLRGRGVGNYFGHLLGVGVRNK